MKAFTILACGATLAMLAAPALACDGPGRSARRAEMRAQALAEADTDGNGALSPAEFEDFQAAMRRARASHKFAKLDTDGDGQVTAAELNAPRPPHGADR
jgi:hypothetical protein